MRASEINKIRKTPLKVRRILKPGTQHHSESNIFKITCMTERALSGNAFGNPNCIRISYAASEEELRKAIQQIKEALQ